MKARADQGAWILKNTNMDVVSCRIAGQPVLLQEIMQGGQMTENKDRVLS
jgi:hypothetical protein